MLTTLIAFTVLAPAAKPFVCPVQGEEIKDLSAAGFHDYNGARFWFCCAGCDKSFAKEPGKYVAQQAKAKKVTGDFMFDPVSGMRLKSPGIIAETSDYQGIRYHFSSKENKAKFDKEPAKYGTLPKQEALFCPVAKEDIAAYANAASYVDFKGVRYYTCCAGCVAKLKEDPAKYAPNAKDHVKTPGVATEQADH